MEIESHELAWAAGFFDGEGHVGLHKRLGPRLRNARISVRVVQAEPLVIERFKKAIGDFGSIYGPRDNGPGRRPVWIWNSTNHEQAQALIALLWRFLGPVKREQARLALIGFAEVRQAWRNECRKGHDLTLPNAVYVAKSGVLVGKRICRLCMKSGKAAYYQRGKRRLAMQIGNERQ